MTSTVSFSRSALLLGTLIRRTTTTTCSTISRINVPSRSLLDRNERRGERERGRKETGENGTKFACTGIRTGQWSLVREQIILFLLLLTRISASVLDKQRAERSECVRCSVRKLSTASPLSLRHLDREQMKYKQSSTARRKSRKHTCQWNELLADGRRWRCGGRLTLGRRLFVVRMNRRAIKCMFSYSNECRRLRHEQVDLDAFEKRSKAHGDEKFD